MNINNSELEFLVTLSEKLTRFACTVREGNQLKQLTDKLIARRNKKRESVRATVAKKRKADKTYGRSKAEIETMKRRAENNG